MSACQGYGSQARDGSKRPFGVRAWQASAKFGWPRPDRSMKQNGPEIRLQSLRTRAKRSMKGA